MKNLKLTHWKILPIRSVKKIRKTPIDFVFIDKNNKHTINTNCNTIVKPDSKKFIVYPIIYGISYAELYQLYFHKSNL